MNLAQERIAIIGAGLSGLVAARQLARKGRRVVLFDKGRKAGGRTSVRRLSGFEFDHGAQYFTVNDPRFRDAVDDWIRRGVVARWEPRIGVLNPEGMTQPREDRDRFVGTPGMNAMARDLARDLDVRSGIVVGEIARLESGQGRDGRVWQILDSAGASLGEFGTVLVTAPPLQTAALLPMMVDDLRVETLSVEMQPCWAVLLGFPSRLELDLDAAFINEGPLSWVARNSSKPGRGKREAWVLHATGPWSKQHWDLDPREVELRLRQAFLEFVLTATGRNGETPEARVSQTSMESGAGAGAGSSGSVERGALPPVEASDQHRWAYSQPVSPLLEPCIFDPIHRIGIAGDWCGGPKVEGAFLSGLSLADQVLAEQSLAEQSLAEQVGAEQLPPREPERGT